MCVQCWAAIAAAAHTYSNIIPVQRRGACLSRDGPRKKIYISKYLSVGTDDNSRAEAKGAGSFVEGGQYSYSFPNTTSDTTHGWGI